MEAARPSAQPIRCGPSRSFSLSRSIARTILVGTRRGSGGASWSDPEAPPRRRRGTGGPISRPSAAAMGGRPAPAGTVLGPWAPRPRARSMKKHKKGRTRCSIVLGVDGSESSSSAADLASKMAAEVVLVHVRERARSSPCVRS